MTPFMTYYEHLAKIPEIANKRTLFLAHVLSNVKFSKTVRLHIVDLTRHMKLEIMRSICPELTDTQAALNRASQYLQSLKRADLVKPMPGLQGTWMIDPMSFGGMKVISKQLREKNAAIFATYQFTRDEATLEIKAFDDKGNEVFFNQQGEEFPELRAVE